MWRGPVPWEGAERLVGKLIFCLAMGIAWPVLADVTVIDGDTLNVDGEMTDLHGIAAPEYRQACPDGWPAGAMATEVLRELVRDRKVTCEPKAKRRYSPTLAVCWVDGLDLGSMMVRAGWAWALPVDGSDYVRQETEAWTGRLGVHGHNCERVLRRQ